MYCVILAYICKSLVRKLATKIWEKQKIRYKSVELERYPQLHNLSHFYSTSNVHSALSLVQIQSIKINFTNAYVKSINSVVDPKYWFSILSQYQT